MFATILYFMVGLADRESASNFFIYLSLLLLFAILMNQQLAVFASFASEGALSALSAVVILFLILFGGFIIVPSSIPIYYSWLYWWNPAAWVYRSLVLNEFTTDRWDSNSELTNAGMLGYNGKPYGREWIWYAYAYMASYTLICIVLTTLGLVYLRNEEKPPALESKKTAASEEDEKAAEESKEAMLIAFKPVTLSFRDVCYDVKASTSKDTLRLLKSVNGIFRAGRMCALMGSSGAGKTTLMVRYRYSDLVILIEPNYLNTFTLFSLGRDCPKKA